MTDTQDKVWQLTVQLKELVDLVCAPKISLSSRCTLCHDKGLSRNEDRDISHS